MAHVTGYRQQLRRYRDRALGALMRGLPSGGPPHLYDLVKAYPARDSKGLRAALCIASCRAFGGSTAQALNSAVALELFHNGFLVHDDLQDGSLFRRGESTLHTRYGNAIAVNVGNATHLQALRTLMDNGEILGPRTTWLVMEEAERMLRHTLEGQAIELGWIFDNACELRDRDYLQMCLKKTCWYSFIHPLRVGAIVATGARLDSERLCRFGWYLGAAFQIQDDLLNLEGHFQAYGKEIDGDLVEGKRTLMLIHLLQKCSRREKAQLRTMLGAASARRSATNVARLRRLLKKYDSLDYARRCGRQLAGAAFVEGLAALRDVPDGADKAFILGTVAFVVGRDR
jgi:geranylgeranyl diphosphate synthase type II